MADSSENKSKVTVTISYSNYTAKTYTALVDKHQKFTINQPYSWFSNDVRFILESYSVDNRSSVKIPRYSFGNFTLNIPTDVDHSIVFTGKQQFRINVTGTKNAIFYPPSQTGDSWFDKGSDEQVITPYVIPSDIDTIREQLSGWSLDTPYIDIISRSESGNFKSPVIHVMSSHTIDFKYVTQYHIRVISEYGRPSGTGWYDSGTIITITVIPNTDLLISHVFTGWQGQVIGVGQEDSASVFVDSPKTLVAMWYVDYTVISIITVLVIGVAVILIIYKKRKTTHIKN